MLKKKSVAIFEELKNSVGHIFIREISYKYLKYFTLILF